ncbi:hypothetical protein D3C80_921620 [compost metagenome]
MQQESLIQLLAAALFISLISGAALAIWSARKGHSAGWHRGHDAARNSYADHVEALHSDIGRLNRKCAEQHALHQQDRENLLVDADRRIAIYAQRANPFTVHDAHCLAESVKSLCLAADTFAGVYAFDKQQKALREAKALTAIHERLTQTIEAQQEGTEAAKEATT